MTDLPRSIAPAPAVLGPVEAVESIELAPPRQRQLDRRLVIGASLLAALALVALAAGWLAPYDPLKTNLAPPRSAPSAAHWLGADSLGRDVASRLIHAARVSLIVGFAAVALHLAIGGLVGGVSGYYGGLFDLLLMRIADVVLSFPLFVVVVAVVAVVGPSLLNVVLVIGLLGWPGVARLVRANVLVARTHPYVESARALGASDRRILLRHVLPNILAPIAVMAAFGVARAVLLESSLSFLGLGVQPPTPTWGNMLVEGQSLTTLESMPYLWVPPGVAIAVLVAAISLVGDGLRGGAGPAQPRQSSGDRV